MLTFPTGQNSSLIVIEPGNIKRMKAGRPLQIGEHLVCFTPDRDAFLKALGLDVAPPEPDQRKVLDGFRITPVQLVAALEKCKDLPEVDE